MIKIISWNIGRRSDAWESLLAMDADIALLQEASEPPRPLPPGVEIDPSPWHTAGSGLNRRRKAAVVNSPTVS